MYMIRVEYELNNNTVAHIFGEDQLFCIGKDWECQPVIYISIFADTN